MPQHGNAATWCVLLPDVALRRMRYGCMLHGVALRQDAALRQMCYGCRLHGVALLQAAALRQMRSRQAPVFVLFVYEKGDSYAR